MKEDKIKEAFSKIREDMDYFFEEIQQIKANFEEHKQASLNLIKRTLEEVKNTTQKPNVPTLPTDIPTNQQPLRASNDQYLGISTGNEGVPTNQQTNQQTNQRPLISTDKFALNKMEQASEDPIAKLEQASKIIESLDELKKEVRVKFKKLTDQEMLIFSTIYQLDDQNISVDYSVLSQKLKLSETSIRDYIRKIIKKGIPIDKNKQTNNKITLSIASSIKKIASLNTILRLREL